MQELLDGKASSVPAHVRKRFDPSPAAIQAARAFLQDAIAGRAENDSEELTLVLSELATNAVEHAGTPFEVVVETDGFVRIEVEDGSTAKPVKQSESPTAVHGRGLQIVEDVCDRWGVHVAHDRKCVWCERELT